MKQQQQQQFVSQSFSGQHLFFPLFPVTACRNQQTLPAFATVSLRDPDHHMQRVIERRDTVLAAFAENDQVFLFSMPPNRMKTSPLFPAPASPTSPDTTPPRGRGRAAERPSPPPAPKAKARRRICPESPDQEEALDLTIRGQTPLSRGFSPLLAAIAAIAAEDD